MDQIEVLMHASLPPSPTSSPTHHLRLGSTSFNQRLRGVTSSSGCTQPELASTHTIQSSLEQQQSNQMDEVQKVTKDNKEQQKPPSTPTDRNIPQNSNLFSSPFSDESTPTKILDVARKNC